ncbi:MAG: ATP/GTP-binding protein [Frankiales bacterium]|nr:ATP/GTP-binding protein [Frankiales bacterium]
MGKGSRRGAREAQALAALRSEDEPARRPVGVDRVEDGYVVRHVGTSPTAYRCPGCDHEFAGVPHVVAWPEGDPDSRRHWHTPCWTARTRRRRR